jgi:hypothetical protein
VDGEPTADGEPAASDPPGDEPRPWVEGVPLDTRLRAHRIFLDGNVLIKEGLFARAAARYREAIALWDHPIFHYNLAIAQINLDQPIGAYQSFQRALRHGGRAIGPDRSEQARSFLTLLGNQLAHLEVACDEPGAVVTLDGKPLLTAPGSTRLMALPGGHQLMADKPGRLPDTRQVVLAPGQRARFRLAPRIPDQLVTERRWPAWRLWAVVGAGLAASAAGAVVDWRAFAAFDRYDDGVAEMCGDTRGCPAATFSASLRRMRQDAATLERAAHATYLVGGATLAAGAVLLYLNRERPVRRRDDTPDAALLPAFTPDTASVSVRWRF